MPTKTKPSPKSPAPKARVMPKARILWISPEVIESARPITQQIESQIPVLVRPYRTKQQAQGAKRFANLSYNEKSTCLAGAITFGSLSYRLSDAHSILKLLGGGGEMSAKKNEFPRGWYACLAVLCEIEGQANTTAKELWAAGGSGDGADPYDLATLAQYGLTPPSPRPSKQRGKKRA